MHRIVMLFIKDVVVVYVVLLLVLLGPSWKKVAGTMSIHGSD
jgi:hypothetical protein